MKEHWKGTKLPNLNEARSRICCRKHQRITKKTVVPEALKIKSVWRFFICVIECVPLPAATNGGFNYVATWVNTTICKNKKKPKKKTIQTKTTLFQTLKSIFVRIIRELSLLKKLNPCFIRLLETKRVRAVVCLFITTWAALYWEEKCLIYIEIEAEYFVNTVLKPHSMGIH